MLFAGQNVVATVIIIAVSMRNAIVEQTYKQMGVTHHFLVLHPVWNGDFCFTEKLEVCTVHITYNVQPNHSCFSAHNFPF